MGRLRADARDAQQREPARDGIVQPRIGMGQQGSKLGHGNPAQESRLR